MSWYGTNPNRVIDGRLALEGAGAWGRGLKSVGSAMSEYDRLKYKKKRDALDDENLKDTNSTKVDVAKIGYKKSTDTAEINKSAKVYQADTSERNNKRTTKATYSTNMTKEKVAKIGAGAKVTSAKLNLKGKVYQADTSSENNKRTNATSAENSKRSSKTQHYVADTQKSAAKMKLEAKALPKKSKAKDWKIQALKSAKTPEERMKILKMKNIGEEEI